MAHDLEIITYGLYKHHVKICVPDILRNN